MVLAGDVMAEVAKALFDPATVHRMQTAEFQTESRARRHQHLKDMSRHLGADVELPTQFAHIGHPMRPGEAHADLDLPRHAEGVRFVREVIGGYRLQHLPRLWSHNGEDRFARRHIRDHNKALARMTAQPCFIRQPRRGGGDDEIGRFAEPRHGDIRLDPAPRVEELGIDNLAHRHRHLRTADMVHESLGLWPLDPDLAEGRHIIKPDARADGGVFGGLIFEPVLPAPSIAIFARLAGIGEPIGPLPACKFAHDRAMLLQMCVHRAAPDAPRGRLLAIGKVIGIEQAQRFGRPRRQIGLIALKRLHSRDVHVTQIKGFLPVFHPLRQRHARAARRLNPDRVEPGGDPDIVHLGGLTEVIGIIGGETFGTIEKGVNPRVRQQWQPFDGHLKDRLEMVEIFGQLVKLETLGDALQRPWLGDRLKRTKQDFARILFVIGILIGDTQHRQFTQGGNGFGDDIEMLAGLQRHVTAQHPAHVPPPHACAIDDMLGLDLPRAAILPGPIYCCDPTPRAHHAGGLDPLRHDRTTRPRALGQRQCNIGRIALPVFRQIDCAGYAFGLYVGILGVHFRGGDFLDLHAKGAGHGGLTQNFLAPRRCQRGSDRPHALEPRGDPGFRLKRAVEFLGIFRQPRHVLRRAQLRDQPCRVPCGARGQLFTFQQYDIGPAELCQMVRDRTADHATADDDGPGFGRQLYHFRPPARGCGCFHCPKAARRAAPWRDNSGQRFPP